MDNMKKLSDLLKQIQSLVDGTGLSKTKGLVKEAIQIVDSELRMSETSSLSVYDEPYSAFSNVDVGELLNNGNASIY